MNFKSQGPINSANTFLKQSTLHRFYLERLHRYGVKKMCVFRPPCKNLNVKQHSDRQQLGQMFVARSMYNDNTIFILFQMLYTMCTICPTGLNRLLRKLHHYCSFSSSPIKPFKLRRSSLDYNTTTAECFECCT